MSRLSILSALALTLFGNLLAAPKDKVEVRFLVERLPGNLGQVTLASGETRSEPFDLPMNNLSAPRTVPERRFDLWSVERDRSLGAVRLPEEGGSFVVLLLPRSTGVFEPVVMPFDGDTFRPGNFYFHNNTKKTVLGYVGTARFSLKPGEGRVLEPEGARKEKFYDVGLGVREEGGDRVLTTTRWPEDNRTRFYVFFYKDGRTGRITFRGVDEFVMPPEEDEG